MSIKDITLDNHEDIIVQERTPEASSTRISSKPSDSETVEELCQVCRVRLDTLTLSELQGHYNEHLAQSTVPSGSSPSASTSSLARTLQLARRAVSRPVKDVFWYPLQGVNPPDNYTPGLIPLLKQALMVSHAKGVTQRAALCYVRTVHISHEPWDAGWGCGYRNYLMACTALMDQSSQVGYFPLLNGPPLPGIQSLQNLIEQAWKDGYDKEGAQQLKQKLAGYTKWIGTAELYVAYTYLGIPSQLVDFHLSSGDAGPLIRWIRRYFSPPERDSYKSKCSSHGSSHDSAIVISDCMPLVLQHSGHSRTIVGYEVQKQGAVNLLAFDPSKWIPKEIRRASIQSFWSTLQNTETDMPDYEAKTAKEGHAKHFIQHIKKPFQKWKTNHSLEKNTHKEKSLGEKEIGSAELTVVVDDPSRSVLTDLASQKEPQLDIMQNYTKILKLVRVDEKALSKHDRYQILWFPLADPLNEEEKQHRQVVTSNKLC